MPMAVWAVADQPRDQEPLTLDKGAPVGRLLSLPLQQKAPRRVPGYRPPRLPRGIHKRSGPLGTWLGQGDILSKVKMCV